MKGFVLPHKSKLTEEEFKKLKAQRDGMSSRVFIFIEMKDYCLLANG